MKPSIVSLLRLIVMIFGLIFIVTSFLQWQTVQYEKKAGGPMYTDIYTQEAAPGSVIHVKWSADKSILVRAVKLENRNVYEDKNGNITDTQVTLKGSGSSGEEWGYLPSISRTGYLIIVTAPEGANYTIRDVGFKLSYDLWFPNYEFMTMGIVLLGLGILHLTLIRMRIPVATPQQGPGPLPIQPYMAPGQPAPYQPRGPQTAPGPGYQRGVQQRQGPGAPPQEGQGGGYPEDAGYDDGQGAAPYGQYDDGRGAPPPQQRGPPQRQMRAPPPPPEEAPEQRRPIARIRCSACGEVIPIYSRERPQRVTCSNCGRSGTLK
jgi:hypothetical protein